MSASDMQNPLMSCQEVRFYGAVCHGNPNSQHKPLALTSTLRTHIYNKEQALKETFHWKQSLGEPGLLFRKLQQQLVLQTNINHPIYCQITVSLFAITALLGVHLHTLKFPVMSPTGNQISYFIKWWSLKPEEQVKCHIRANPVLLSSQRCKGITTWSSKQLKGEKGAVWWEPMEHPYSCTIQSNISPCLQLSRNWGHSQVQIKILLPSWENNRTLSAWAGSCSQARSNYETLCKAAVTPEACSCAQVWSPQGAQVIWLSPFLSPWSLPRFAVHHSWDHCSFPAGHCVCGQCSWTVTLSCPSCTSEEGKVLCWDKWKGKLCQTDGIFCVSEAGTWQ